MQITGPVIVAIVSIVVGLLMIYLALSGRLEGILKASPRYARGSQQSPEPMRLTDFSKDLKGETWGSVKKKE